MLPTNLSVSWVPNKTTKKRLVLFFWVKREWFKNTCYEHLLWTRGLSHSKELSFKGSKRLTSSNFWNLHPNNWLPGTYDSFFCQLLRGLMGGNGWNSWNFLPFCGVFFVQKMRDWVVKLQSGIFWLESSVPGAPWGRTNIQFEQFHGFFGQKRWVALKILVSSVFLEKICLGLRNSNKYFANSTSRKGFQTKRLFQVLLCPNLRWMFFFFEFLFLPRIMEKSGEECIPPRRSFPSQ